MNPQLRIPGPTPLPPAVLQSLSKPMISHRSAEFHRLLTGISERLRQVIGTANDVVVLTASGTGGLEAAIANTIEPGDRVLSVRVGHFGRRFAEIAERFGASLDYLDFAPGRPADPEALAGTLRRGRYRAVLVTHCETSTGVLNDLAGLAHALEAADERPLLLIDGVSSLAGTPLGLAEDDYDVVVTASQKAWMAPPGLSMLAVSRRGWQRIEACRSPRLYLDLAEARRYGARGETPWTPGLTLLYGLDTALDMILDEGLPRVFARHLRLASQLRRSMRAAGLHVLAAEEWASPTVTAALLPDGVGFGAVSQRLLAHHGVAVADGQDQLKGRAIRIGHMGYIGDADIEHLSSAVAETMQHVASQVQS